MTEGAASVALNPQEPSCPGCKTPFKRKRSNQLYCSSACQKAASRNAARGPRDVENANRNRDHYSRAAWLCYDIVRMPEARRDRALHDLLVTAKGAGGAKLRNILLDPRLLGAPRDSPLGKLYPDTSDPSVSNIAKQTNAYCRLRWGKGSRELLKGGGEMPLVPDDTPEAKPAAATYWQRLRQEGKLGRKVVVRVDPGTAYDWRRLAKAMRDPGWRPYYTQEELDEMLEIHPRRSDRGSLAASFGDIPGGDVDLLEEGVADAGQLKLAA